MAMTRPPRDGVSFDAAGDVFRRDEVDRSHYPVFHQLDGARMFAPEAPPRFVPRRLVSLARRERALCIQARARARMPASRT